MNRRHIVRAAAAVLAAGLTGGALLLALPSGAGLPPDVRVIDSHAAAAAVGLLSRVPAESDGGVLYSSTALTLDKTQARAAGFTGGDLAETFFESSSDKYRNPTLINAQFPPTAHWSPGPAPPPPTSASPRSSRWPGPPPWPRPASPAPAHRPRPST